VMRESITFQACGSKESSHSKISVRALVLLEKGFPGLWGINYFAVGFWSWCLSGVVSKLTLIRL
jgi:hypothetical protein